jgi:hypothetical protein
VEIRSRNLFVANGRDERTYGADRNLELNSQFTWTRSRLRAIAHGVAEEVQWPDSLT